MHQTLMFVHHFIKKYCQNKRTYAIINMFNKEPIGAWYNGSIGVSKTFDGSSILSAPAIRKHKDSYYKSLFYIHI